MFKARRPNLTIRHAIARLSEFIYRFWIENEIWYGRRSGKLSPDQRRYAEHYR